MKIAIASAIAATLALSMTPAFAKSKNQYHHHGYQSQSWNGGWQGWNTRQVSDPSFGNRAGLNNARRNGRCVTDLGYGRFEYCGW